MPRPRVAGGRRIWDVEELDLAFKALPREGGEEELFSAHPYRASHAGFDRGAAALAHCGHRCYSRTMSLLREGPLRTEKSTAGVTLSEWAMVADAEIGNASAGHRTQEHVRRVLRTLRKTRPEPSGKMALSARSMGGREASA